MNATWAFGYGAEAKENMRLRDSRGEECEDLREGK
jgi:hypothetical protein